MSSFCGATAQASRTRSGCSARTISRCTTKRPGRAAIQLWRSISSTAASIASPTRRSVEAPKVCAAFRAAAASPAARDRRRAERQAASRAASIGRPQPIHAARAPASGASARRPGSRTACGSSCRTPMLGIHRRASGLTRSPATTTATQPARRDRCTTSSSASCTSSGTGRSRTGCSPRTFARLETASTYRRATTARMITIQIPRRRCRIGLPTLGLACHCSSAISTTRSRTAPSPSPSMHRCTATSRRASSPTRRSSARCATTSRLAIGATSR